MPKMSEMTAFKAGTAGISKLMAGTQEVWSSGGVIAPPPGQLSLSYYFQARPDGSLRKLQSYYDAPVDQAPYTGSSTTASSWSDTPIGGNAVHSILYKADGTCLRFYLNGSYEQVSVNGRTDISFFDESIGSNFLTRIAIFSDGSAHQNNVTPTPQDPNAGWRERPLPPGTYTRALAVGYTYNPAVDSVSGGFFLTDTGDLYYMPHQTSLILVKSGVVSIARSRENGPHRHQKIISVLNNGEVWTHVPDRSSPGGMYSVKALGAGNTVAAGYGEGNWGKGYSYLAADGTVTATNRYWGPPNAGLGNWSLVNYSEEVAQADNGSLWMVAADQIILPR
jgi:hypothetical protein